MQAGGWVQETLVVLGTALVLAVALPVFISRMMARGRRKRQAGGGGSDFDDAFDMLDPARVRARVVIQAQKEVGRTDQGAAGESLDRNDAPSEPVPRDRE